MATESDYSKFKTQLVDCIAGLDYFSAFDKIIDNVHKGKLIMHLNALNCLLHSPYLEKSVRDLFEENPKAFSDINILIATRDKNKNVLDRNKKTRTIDSYFDNANDIWEFIQDTNLNKLFADKDITDLVSYVFGVETGMDTNARKNRSGNLMEYTVEKIIKGSGKKYLPQVNSNNYSELKDILGKDNKIFDFVIKTDKMNYAIEVNFFGGGGSKPSEIVRSFETVNSKLNSSKNFKFVWVTDGPGWKGISNFEDAFGVIPNIYNLTTFEEFLKNI
jgi:type II restriction enzyme